MTPGRIDLHTHTAASDGTLEPLALFDLASETGLQVLSVTDHDSTAGFEAILCQRDRHPRIRLIPGVEMNADGEFSCHLLGYFVNVADKRFQARLLAFREMRNERCRAMVQRLEGLGYPIAFEKVVALANGGSIGRPHVADALIEAGVTSSRQEAFDRFLKKDGPAYVEGHGPGAAEIIRVIREAGGIPVLAHPSYYTSEDLLRRLVDAGLLGLEVFYPEHSRNLKARYLEMTRHYGLVATGGSDFHGPRTGRSGLGSVSVPDEVVFDLESARKRV